MDIERDLDDGVDELVSELGMDPALGNDDDELFESIHESHTEDEERAGD